MANSSKKENPGPVAWKVPLTTNLAPDSNSETDLCVHIHRRPVYALRSPDLKNLQPWIIKLQQDKYTHIVHPLIERPYDIKLLPETLPIVSATSGLLNSKNFRVKELGQEYAVDYAFWVNMFRRRLNTKDLIQEGHLHNIAVRDNGDGSFVVLAIYMDGSLAIYESGHKDWVITEPHGSYSDVVLSNGRLFAVDVTGLMVEVHEEEEGLTSSVVVPPIFHDDLRRETFLVDSDGELFLVVREEEKEKDDYDYDYDDDDDDDDGDSHEFWMRQKELLYGDDDYNRTVKFKVFILNKNNWMAKSDLGDKILFLGMRGYGKFAASASDIFADDTCHVGSRIFFIDKHVSAGHDGLWHDADIQMFDLKSSGGNMGSIDSRSLYPMMCWPPPSWVNSAASIGPGTYHDQSDWLINYRNLVNENPIQASQPDVVRTIPSMVDGLKAGQRKMLFCSFKRNFIKRETVHEFLYYMPQQYPAYRCYAGRSLEDTITSVAQMFVGSNSINFTEPDGGLYGRLEDGYHCGLAKYNYTDFSSITRLLFPKEDDILYGFEDGKFVEPTWYVPVIPTVLVNGCEGSSFVPNYNPRDIIANVRRLLKDEEMVPMLPWYRRFYGPIKESATNEVGNTYTVTGALARVDDKTLHITELPIGKGTKDFEKFLDSVHTKNVKDPLIEGYSGHCDGLIAHFLVYLPKENFDLDDVLVQKFKLTTTISTCNMHLTDPKGVMKTYKTPEKILEDFFPVRKEYYMKRKKAMSKNLDIGALKCKSKAKAINDGRDWSITPINTKRGELFDELMKKGFIPFPKKKSVEEVAVAGPSDDTAETEVNTDMATSQEGSSPKLEVQDKCWKDLWEKDLCALESKLDEIEKEDEIFKMHVQNIIAKARSKATEKESAAEPMDVSGDTVTEAGNVPEVMKAKGRAPAEKEVPAEKAAAEEDDDTWRHPNAAYNLDSFDRAKDIMDTALLRCIDVYNLDTSDRTKGRINKKRRYQVSYDAGRSKK